MIPVSRPRLARAAGFLLSRSQGAVLSVFREVRLWYMLMSGTEDRGYWDTMVAMGYELSNRVVEGGLYET